MPIAILNFVLSKIPLIPTSDSLFLSAQIVNLGLCILSGFLLFKLGRKYLNKPYSVLLIILFFLSPTLLDYNIRILSENLYIPLFLGFFLAIQKLMEEASLKNGYVKVGHINVEVNNKLDVVKAGILTCFLLGLLYITRSEAFIYLAGVILCIFYL
ncbi:MAG: hypothetical protein H6767_06925 [Candidatus Peribacteria bacterium]|nr:MAG: hypothetical protein H6767_06925 [Candidatus Peribacteria bacterium]